MVNVIRVGMGSLEVEENFICLRGKFGVGVYFFVSNIDSIEKCIRQIDLTSWSREYLFGQCCKQTTFK